MRKIACDADIIPILLGSEGRILDIGRTTRIFPPHIRKAITARDQGCTFPNCTIPAPWCEAHHTTYWSHGGPTNTDNGTLLCTHHHHLIHKEQWTIHMQTGIPWFIPPTPHRPQTNTPPQPPTPQLNPPGGRARGSDRAEPAERTVRLPHAPGDHFPPLLVIQVCYL
ncbi:HNH endonuclease signature motif containing protein [Burkholderia sp. LFS038]|uniref:HNH endonuclease signature motif containing protein n=1 Tax=Burkholderia sp. LFS038 TaxID=3229884 RepID=UPI003A7FD2C6